MILKAGTTLIELLLAITIALLVIAVIFSMHHTAVRVIESQEEQNTGPAAAALAVDQIVRDLHCAAAPGESTDCVFTLGFPDSANPAELHLRFCTAGVPTEDDQRWFEYEHVLYRYRPGSDRDGILTREHTMLAGPGSVAPATTNILATRLEQLDIAVFDGSGWVSEWTTGGLPRGARLRTVCGGRTYTAEAFIPAANTVTSRIIRAATPAP